MSILVRIVPRLALAGLLVPLLGCPTTQPPEPEEPLLVIDPNAPTNESSCEDRLSFAREAMDTVVRRANGACTTDADCITVFAETQCLGACQAPILGARLDAFRDAQDAINERACTDYAQDGCPYATPACLAVEAVCQQNRCALTELRQ